MGNEPRGLRRLPNSEFFILHSSFWIVLLAAVLLRAAFVFRVPLFVTKDSLEYFEPALSLVSGGPFELAQRRTPIYPLFLAGSISLFGQELLGIALAQHALGVATAALTYAMGRLTFGRAAGLVAGISFFVAGMRFERGWLIALGGLVLGVAALTRPVGQVVLVVVPLALLAHHRAWRPTLRLSALAIGCFALVVVPWAIRNQIVYGTAGAASVGRFLISRSVKHERNFVFYEESVGAKPGEDPLRTRARKIAQDV